MPQPAPIVLTDAYLAINGTAVSGWAHHVDITDQADQIEVTSFGPAGYKQYIPGMKEATVNATFFQDFQASAIDSILEPLYASGGTFGLEVRPTSAMVSSTNPKYTMTARLYAYSGLAGDVGVASEVSAVFQNAGTTGLVRGTS